MRRGRGAVHTKEEGCWDRDTEHITAANGKTREKRTFQAAIHRKAHAHIRARLQSLGLTTEQAQQRKDGGVHEEKDTAKETARLHHARTASGSEFLFFFRRAWTPCVPTTVARSQLWPWLSLPQRTRSFSLFARGKERKQARTTTTTAAAARTESRQKATTTTTAG